VDDVGHFFAVDKQKTTSFLAFGYQGCGLRTDVLKTRMPLGRGICLPFHNFRCDLSGWLWHLEKGSGCRADNRASSLTAALDSSIRLLSLCLILPHPVQRNVSVTRLHGILAGPKGMGRDPLRAAGVRLGRPLGAKDKKGRKKRSPKIGPFLGMASCLQRAASLRKDLRATAHTRRRNAVEGKNLTEEGNRHYRVAAY
jgi:hypothetical protein